MVAVKVGIIGTGFSAQAHIEAIRRLKGVEVVAVSASTIEKAEELAREYMIPRTYADPLELINDPEVEAIHNCTPNDLHFPINRYVLLAGKHLLSEKPLAMTSEESKELAELAEKSQSVATIAFNYRFYPMVAEAKDIMRNKTYGDCHIVYGGYLQDWCLNKTDYSWRMDPEKNGPSRAIADIGSHWCDTVQHILGKKIIEVFADLKTVHPVREKSEKNKGTFSKSQDENREEVAITTEDYGSVLVHFEDGIQGVFTVSQVSAGRKNKFHFDIAAEKATLSWDQEKPNRLWIGKRDEANQELVKDPSLLSESAAALAHYPGGHQEGWPDGLKNLVSEFYDNVRLRKNGEPDKENSSMPTIQDGHYIMKLIDSILESHHTKSWVKI
ncbi:Gfo/Idh/MocA family protein [Jeotgalibacillus soli]|uniref:Oxidoreductase domain protein n=1 Tax=Jeotgalibacillus soli TaxID=889306 RepID=A0A0C2VYD8_9BACL|nr:Gfo/Idh/MocA family oxidoreductase [Jeotgalibacillus soli]KIL49426.1 oxidoreductase domain protein [Jeotgalibacillus soli]